MPRISFRVGLHEVEHRRVPIETTALKAAIDTAVKGLKITPMWLDVPTFYDARAGKNHYGLAFAVSKFEDSFREDLPDRSFRYRDAEIQDALRKIIAEHQVCSGSVRWDRGMGVFVFNVYLKG